MDLTSSLYGTTLDYNKSYSDPMVVGNRLYELAERIDDDYPAFLSYRFGVGD